MFVRLNRIITVTVTVSFLMLLMQTAHADSTSEREAQTVLHMLDYLSVDYGGSVLFGKVLNEREYQEQSEFAIQSAKLLSHLPMHPSKEMLVKEALQIVRDVQAKASAEQVGASAQALRKKIIVTYKVPVSPRQIPDSQRAAVLYQKLCVPCHGPSGHGDGSESNNFNPKPANFHDATRMGKRSVYGLYNTISLGVARTGMVGFMQLSEDERWALAFYVSNFHNLPERLELGRKLWERRDFQGAVPNLVALTTLTANEVSISNGDNARAVFEYLRAEPRSHVTSRHATLIFATEQLDLALARYRLSDQAGAQQFAIAAYLEGFEPMEISLTNLNAQLRLDIEREMMAIRQFIYTKAPAETLAIKIENAKDLLNQADELLREGKLSVSGAFASSLFILLREGLVAILILAALITLVARSGQRNALAYIHVGWGSALLMGMLTWVAATWLVNISGAGREITSGITALIASAMLICVGFWLYVKARAQVRQKFLRHKAGVSLEMKTLLALALISFLAVYREVMEIVLFYQALWTQTSEGTRPALWSGILASVMTLLALGWGLFRFGIKLPLATFFSATSLLLAMMAVIFAGQGVSSLQGAGVVTTSLIDFISLPMLGVFPTIQTLLTQVSVIGILILCYLILIRNQRSAQNDNPPVSGA